MVINKLCFSPNPLNANNAHAPHAIYICNTYTNPCAQMLHALPVRHCIMLARCTVRRIALGTIYQLTNNIFICQCVGCCCALPSTPSPQYAHNAHGK